MSEILSVTQKPLVDENIIKKEYHTYLPYLQNFKNSDEIRISIQNQDLYLLPHESLIYIEGFLRHERGDDITSGDFKIKLNGMAFLFDEIRYEINGMEVDKTRNLGISSTIKNYVSLTENEDKTLRNAGWAQNEIQLENGYFNFCVPLKTLLGFAEDFKKIILNCKHELILLRSKDDNEVFYCTNQSVQSPSLTITNISWKIPHIELADFAKLQVFKIIKSGQPLLVPFRSWDSHFNPVLAQSRNNIWNVKLTSKNDRPRFVLIAFYNNTTKKFTHCDLTDIKLYLNSETYPYDDLNLNFAQDRYAILYEMYRKFQEVYYLRDTSHALLNRESFKNIAPIIVLDVTHQNEAIKTGSLDIKIEFKTEKNVPANTSVYCLLIHDKIIEYVPLTGEIKKMI